MLKVFFVFSDVFAKCNMLLQVGLSSVWPCCASAPECEHVSVCQSFWQRVRLLMKSALTVLPVLDHAFTVATFVCTHGSPTIKLSRCAMCIYVPVVIL